MNSSLRIGIDARPLSKPGMAGISRYVEEMLRAIHSLNTGNEFFLYSVHPLCHPIPSGMNWHIRSSSVWRSGNLWLNACAPFWAVHDRLDIFWGTQHVLPLLMPRRIKTVLSMMDVIFRILPETLNTASLWISRTLVGASLRRADSLVFISDTTRRDTDRFFGPLNKPKRTIYLGVSPDLLAVSGIKRESLRPTDVPYILAVGTFEPRKNLVNACRAFATIADRIPHQLVLAGHPGWKNIELKEELEHNTYRQRIRLLTDVEDTALRDLYAGADLFVFPSLYEGFGLPPLEAMAHGVPVVSSDAPCMPEILGDACVFVNARDPKNIGEGILDVLQNPSRRQALIDKGRARLQQFSWQNAAVQMVDVLNKVMA
jgi:glycosyltransferase involved in cell wall biosynthesis